MGDKYFDKLTGKYAILLSFFYLGTIVLPTFGILNGLWLLAYLFLTNMVIAVMVNYDMKKTDIKRPIIVWSCIFFSLLGVVFFLLEIIRQQKKANA